MANKSVLFGGRTVKVKNRSGFDKSRLNALTTGVGTITPILKQLLIPSSGKCTVDIHAELPPLATDAFLRSHLKVEAFFCPMRLCYGGFQSWFAKEPVIDVRHNTPVTAALPCAFAPSAFHRNGGTHLNFDLHSLFYALGPNSLTDYFNVKFNFQYNQQSAEYDLTVPEYDVAQDPNCEYYGVNLNLFPYVAYHLIYDHFYRNKSVSSPAFTPPADFPDSHLSDYNLASYLPYISFSDRKQFVLGSSVVEEPSTDVISDNLNQANSAVYNDILNNGRSLYQTRQRNYGDDYFTAAKPSAGGQDINVTVTNGKFTIGALRMQNALAEFADVNNYATPDYVQTLSARYGTTISESVAQKPVLLGSADFPMYTKGVELNNQSVPANSNRNPFANQGILGSTGGRASANGQQFVCDFDVKEPGYLMVMATLVPEANYASGISHDMRIFTGAGDLTDMPCGLLEQVGDEPIMDSEIYAGTSEAVFGYVQRYLWHKSGGTNEIHGLYRKGADLQAFIPQRVFTGSPQISSNFLEVPKTALDGIAAVSSGVSDYGVLMDCAIKLFVSEPLSESALPSLADPATEHGRSVYLKNGGSKL